MTPLPEQVRGRVAAMQDARTDHDAERRRVLGDGILMEALRDLATGYPQETRDLVEELIGEFEAMDKWYA